MPADVAQEEDPPEAEEPQDVPDEEPDDDFESAESDDNVSFVEDDPPPALPPQSSSGTSQGGLRHSGRERFLPGKYKDFKLGNDEDDRSRKAGGSCRCAPVVLLSKIS